MVFIQWHTSLYWFIYIEYYNQILPILLNNYLLISFYDWDLLSNKSSLNFNLLLLAYNIIDFMWDAYSDWLLYTLCHEYVYDFQKVSNVINQNYLDSNFSADDCRKRYSLLYQDKKKIFEKKTPLILQLEKIKEK